MEMPRWAKIGLAVVTVVGLSLFGAWALMIAMPDSSYDGEVPKMDDELRKMADRLESDVRMLAETIGPRHVGRPEGLEQSVAFLEGRLEKLGFEPRRHSFEVRGVPCHNLEVEIEGHSRPDEIVIIGAHYDSYLDTPAANDNGSGVAANLELARQFADAPRERTLRFVFFVNEEPPWFQTEDMGSWVYAKRSRDRGEDIAAMVSLETIGYFDDTPDSQDYPVGMLQWVYSDKGDFIAFVANVGSRKVLREAMDAFRDQAKIPSEGAALPGFIPGVGWSDHWAFWQESYPGIMVTDTALFRYPHYHQMTDTPDRLDYERMALVVDGLTEVVQRLTNG